MLKRVVVTGAGGFIGSHLVKRLKAEGCFVRGLDIKRPEFDESAADEMLTIDLRYISHRDAFFDNIDEVYALAADMGGVGYISVPENDATILRNSTLINVNTLENCRLNGVKRVFFSSSACVYNDIKRIPKVAWVKDPPRDNNACREQDAYPAEPDSEYGWEKLFAERMYLAYGRCYGLDVRIARYHNIFGPLGTWTGGREKAPAAVCRKVAEAADHTNIELWGDGKATRSFLYIDECIEGTRRLMDSDFTGPVNIGSNEMVSIDTLARMVKQISGKTLGTSYVKGPQGVRGRNSDNTLIFEKLGWKPSASLYDGLKQLYPWVLNQVDAAANK